MTEGTLVDTSGNWIANYELEIEDGHWNLAILVPGPGYDPEDEFPSFHRTEYSGVKEMLWPEIQRKYGYGCSLKEKND